jgi:hypothetical protein
MNRARAVCQNRLAAKVVSHHVRQRATVRRLTPNISESLCTRTAVAPCCIVATSTTIAARYALRPRNRSEGGVLRLRQSRRAQQTLNRQHCSLGSMRARGRRSLRR